MMKTMSMTAMKKTTKTMETTKAIKKAKKNQHDYDNRVEKAQSVGKKGVDHCQQIDNGCMGHESIMP